MTTLNEYRFEILGGENFEIDEFIEECCEIGLVWWQVALPINPRLRPFSNLMDVDGDEGLAAEIESFAADHNVTLTRVPR